MSKIICIDPGHGGADPGAVNGSRHEKNDTLKIALQTKSHLERCGFTVYLTRDTDKTVNLYDRPKYANSVKADYFLTVHRNSYNSTSTGLEGWIHSKSLPATVDMANKIFNQVINVANVTNRGVKKGYTGEPDADYAVNRISTMPSMLLELLFISNESDNKIFDSNIDNYAVAICKGLCNAFGVVYVDIPKPTVQATKKLYRVQVGAFANKENADKLIAELQAKGYQAFIN